MYICDLGIIYYATIGSGQPSSFSNLLYRTRSYKYTFLGLMSSTCCQLSADFHVFLPVKFYRGLWNLYNLHMYICGLAMFNYATLDRGQPSIFSKLL